MGCSPWIPRNSSHRPQYDDTGASRHVESNTVEVLWVSAGFVATDFSSGPRPLPTHAQPACFPRPTKNSEDPQIGVSVGEADQSECAEEKVWILVKTCCKWKPQNVLECNSTLRSRANREVR